MANTIAEPKHQLDYFSDLSDKNGLFKMFRTFSENF
jgi:hypothetical protein